MGNLNLIYDVECKIISRSGNRISDTIMFEAISPVELDSDMIEALQMEKGYHPLGYGGPNRLGQTKTLDGKFRYTWTCYACCD